MVFCTNPNHYEKLIYYNLVKSETVQKSIETMNNLNSTIVEKNHNLFMIGFEFGANLLNKIINNWVVAMATILNFKQK